jgi:hypothetical protein
MAVADANEACASIASIHRHLRPMLTKPVQSSLLLQTHQEFLLFSKPLIARGRIFYCITFFTTSGTYSMDSTSK